MLDLITAAWHAFLCLWLPELLLTFLVLVGMVLGRPTSVFSQESR